MAEPLLPRDARHAVWDAAAHQLVVVGWRPGPAGVAALDLTPRLRISVDHAQVTTLTELLVAAPGGLLARRELDVLAALLGDEAVAELVDAMRRASSRPRRIGSRLPSEPSQAGEEARMLGQAVLGADLAADDDLDDTERAVAASSAAALFARHFPHVIDGDVLDALHGRGPSQPIALAATMPSFAAAPMPAPEVAAIRQQAAGEPSPIAVDQGGAFAWIDEGGNVVVRAAASHRGKRWARVFRRRDQLLLGFAPVLAGEPAVVVVPPGLGADDVVVDLTDDPAQPRPSETLVAVRGAIRSGRLAARLGREGDPAASDAWFECAAQWQQLGDVQRANLARNYATGSGRRFK